MRIIFLLLIFLSASLFSCTQSKTTEPPEQGSINENIVGKPKVELAAIIKTFGSFWQYYNQYALLHQDFLASDEHGNSITKDTFLQKLKTQAYLPLVLHGETAKAHFKLAKIPAGADSNIGAYMRQDAEIENGYYKLKGKPIPKFSFTDIDGKLYTSENTKGKVILFKCWFIHCVACVNEMPALNKMVQKYKDRDDILFISLAIDNKSLLQKFLAKTKFDYATVADQETYMSKALKVRVYPSHFLINKQGLLVDVVSDQAIIEDLLAKELGELVY